MRVRAISAACTVALAAALVVGAGTAARATVADTTYRCAFPSGTVRAAVTVAATFPERATVGKPFQPTAVRTTVALPPGALAGLGQAATSVAVETRLAVTVGQAGRSATADWLGDAAATTIPDGDGISLTATGPVQSVTVATPGTVSFQATTLALTLTPYQADGSAASAIKAKCVPAGGLLMIGRVPVPTAAASTPGAPSSSPSTAAVPTVPTGASPDVRRPGGTSSGTSGGRAPLVAPRGGGGSFDAAAYHGCGDPSLYPSFRQPIGVYLGGYTNLRKLNGAAQVGFPVSAIASSLNREGVVGQGTPETPTNFDGDHYYCELGTLELNTGGRRILPPVTSTIAAFGFMPVTATAHLSQVGSQPLKAVMMQDWGVASKPSYYNTHAPYKIVSTAALSMRLSDVRVNGVPLDVGPGCRTRGPLYTPNSAADPDDDRIVLVGGDGPDEPIPVYSQILAGGALAGQATIPPFTGCVTPSGDDLDRLLTSTVSGPGNAVRVIQGPECPNTPGCAPGSTSPVHPVSWTLTHGGAFSATAPMTAHLTYQSPTPSGRVRKKVDIIRCPASTMTGFAYDMTGVPRGATARMRWNAPACKGLRGEKWTITQQDDAGLGGLYYDSSTGTTTGRAAGTVTLNRTSPNPCSVTIGNTYGVTYHNSTGELQVSNVLTLGVGEKSLVTASTCPDILTGSAKPGAVTFTPSIGFLAADYTLPPDQAFTLTSP